MQLLSYVVDGFNSSSSLLTSIETWTPWWSL